MIRDGDSLSVVMPVHGDSHLFRGALDAVLSSEPAPEEVPGAPQSG